MEQNRIFKIAGLLLCLAAVTISSCGGGGGGGGSTTVQPSAYTVSGLVSGLTGTGLVLHNNGVDDLKINSNGSFTFSTTLLSEATYSVTVKTQPSSPTQTCTASNNTGKIARQDISDVLIICSANTYAVGGIVTGLTGTGLKLHINGVDALQVVSTGSFTFSSAIADGSGYLVTVAGQPIGPSQTCTANNNSGNVAGANISSIIVTCATNSYSVGGTVSGLVGAGLMLRNNGTDDLSIVSNGTFTFPTSMADGSAYNISVRFQPTSPNQTCTASSKAGGVSGANVSSVVVKCANNAYSVGGVVSGLSGTIVLQNNSGDNLMVSANGSYAFAFPVADTSPYLVTILNQPAGKACYMQNGSGTVSGGAITNVNVDCYNSGSLDAAFGTAGVVLSSFPSCSMPSCSIFGRTPVIDSLGRIIVSGNVDPGAPPSMAILWRFTENGTPDNTFDADGLVTFTTNSVWTFDVGADQFRNIFVSGQTFTPLPSVSMVCKFTESGSLDLTFGGTGIVYASGSESNAMVVQGSKVIVEGFDFAPDRLLLERYNANGTLDTAFGTAGTIADTTASGGTVIIDKAGRIVEAGGIQSGPTSTATIWRFDRDGQPDTEFGINGKVTFMDTPISGIATDSSDRIIAVHALYSASSITVKRYDASGNLDGTFGAGGSVTLNGSLGSRNGRFLAISNDDSIYGAGRAGANMIVVKLKKDGAIDLGFGSSGVASCGSGEANGLTIDGNGKIVVTGRDTSGRMKLCRFHP